ncbi:MAG: hypothetical protein IJO28_05345 [Oscillospiraceae bacterium]|nr:hypothetical protein [Oscillospiraceae bacterium]
MNENTIFAEPTQMQTVPGKKRIHTPSLVVGILSIVFGLLIALAGDILGIVGIVMSAVKKKDYNTTAALICSIVGLVISIINHVLAFLMMMALMA